MATFVSASVETHEENQNTKTLSIDLPLDFSSIQFLPKSHAWPELNNDDQIENNNESSLLALPIIDFHDPNVMEHIGLACEEWGAFQLKNHGIPKSVIKELEVQTKRLFDLPQEQKMKALRSRDNPASGYGTIWITRFFQQCMWQEGFTISGPSDTDAKNIWPDDYQSFCDAMKKFRDESRMLIEKLIHLSFKYLGISKEQEGNWIGLNNCVDALQLNSYPICPNPENAMGIGPHTDTSFFTVVHQFQSSGLQMLKDGSVLHRAIVNNIKHRYSMVYFYRPTMDHVISPLISNNTHDNPRFRAALTLKEYSAIKDKNFDKALSIISVKKD
ncbi:iron ascorbate-dependent oxidoreductase [Stylosanthes scabra]|uniref:Iron ascorbate-dependent oxidoreductase n=1 Tax=Stylosanthes scabra TaxID=79078 RepID=A0ABU6Z0T8_9FABA|nr:iron ascorbate-dependent oxidoreductase [Stylosanthes scabra]